MIVARERGRGAGEPDALLRFRWSEGRWVGSSSSSSPSRDPRASEPPSACSATPGHRPLSSRFVTCLQPRALEGPPRASPSALRAAWPRELEAALQPCTCRLPQTGDPAPLIQNLLHSGSLDEPMAGNLTMDLMFAITWMNIPAENRRKGAKPGYPAPKRPPGFHKLPIVRSMVKIPARALSRFPDCSRRAASGCLWHSGRTPAPCRLLQTGDPAPLIQNLLHSGSLDEPMAGNLTMDLMFAITWMNIPAENRRKGAKPGYPAPKRPPGFHKLPIVRSMVKIPARALSRFPDCSRRAASGCLRNPGRRRLMLTSPTRPGHPSRGGPEKAARLQEHPARRR